MDGKREFLSWSREAGEMRLVSTFTRNGSHERLEYRITADDGSGIRHRADLEGRAARNRPAHLLPWSVRLDDGSEFEFRVCGIPVAHSKNGADCLLRG